MKALILCNTKSAKSPVEVCTEQKKGYSLLIHCYIVGIIIYTGYFQCNKTKKTEIEVSADLH